MSTKYEQCPVCGKKGLRHIKGGTMFHSVGCKYCQNSWATHRWNVKPPYSEPIDPAIIAKRIAAAKKAWEAKQSQTKTT